MRSSFKLTLGIGLLSLVAMGIPACGDDDDGGSGGKSGSGGTGGKDGGTGGSTGGAAGSGGVSGGGGSSGSGGTGGSTTCGGETCQDYKIAGLIDLKACCSANSKCGGDVDATISAATGLPKGCYEIGQKGNDDTSCPPLKFTGLDGGPAEFKGCCNHATSKCGYSVNVSSVGGPDFGCIDATGLTDAPVACTPSTGDAATD